MAGTAGAPPTRPDHPGSSPAFGGRIGLTVAGSEPWWPPRPTPPPGAPNVVVILADDLGYADLGCFGSEIPTPNLDALAAAGVRYTNFHVTPMCSPTRAALLTGVNSHRAGVGHVAHSDPGFPGYAMDLAGNVVTAAETFRANGYATLMVGKWHLTKDSSQSDAGPRDSWPCQRGFDRFYGFLDGFTNLHQPHRLYEDNHVVEVDRYPDDYYFTDDITARAVSMIRGVKAADPTKPFFCYVAHGACHAPLQARGVDIEAHRGRYAAGWDALRDERFRRQQRLGVVEPGTRLASRNTEEQHDVKPWDELDAREQELFARYMEIYAAMVESVDRSFGAIRDALAELGELDNTIIVFTSDNGASREGEINGTSAYFRTLLGMFVDIESFEDDYARLDLLGGPRTLAHYPRGWAMAGNTPFRLYKVNTHAGGHQVPMILSWPSGLGDAEAGTLRRQYVHVTDVLPTLLELTGMRRPEQRAGEPVLAFDGSSFAATLRSPDAPPAHHEQYFEMQGHRGFYRDGWEVVTLHLGRTPFGEHEWELYHLATDPTELHDLSTREPARRRELAEAWDAAAWANQVYPLDEGTGLKWIQRPDTEAVYSRPVTIVAGTPTLERYRSLLLIQARSFTVTVRLDHGSGDAGMLVAHGDQGGGYALYVDDEAGRRELCFVHNGYGNEVVLACGTLPAGEREIVLEVTAPGKWKWDVAVSVDGAHAGALTGLPMLNSMAPFEGIDVGIDRRSPVSWSVYERHGPFPYTGTLRSVTYVPGELAPDAGRRFLDLLRTMGAKFE